MDTALARVCLLGKPALYVEGRLTPFGGPRKAIALLAYVLLHHERALSRAALAELFWPDMAEEDARASLRRHLHRALAALPETVPERPWVLADKVTLRWNPAAPLAIDTHEFERMSANGALEQAVSLYRGDYLEDDYDDWVIPERERLRSLQAANLVALVDVRRRALDYPAAIAFAQALLRLDPLREDAIRRLMSLRVAAGDRSGALADFEAFRRRLRDELATDPMPETFALRESIRSHTHSTLEIGPAIAARPAAAGFPFTGRDAALQALRRAWGNAARGSALTALVSGEAGAGKSRLIGELVALAEAQGGRVLFGTTATIETEPYQCIAEALRGAVPLLRVERLEPAKLAALSSLVSGINARAPQLPALPPLEPERDRERLFDAILSAFTRLAGKRPLLVVVEDLHCAGAATIELLGYLQRNLRDRPVLLVASFREEEVAGSPWLRALLRTLDDSRSSHVALGPLRADDVRALVAGVVPEQPANLAQDIFAASGGNALFVTELLRDRLSGSRGETLPAGIAETIHARVGRLSPAARSLAGIAAVGGTALDVEVIRQVCGWSFAEVYDALDELLDRALVRAAPQRGDFTFSHQLVHAAVYASIDDGLRRGLHRRIGKTLERFFPERPSLSAAIARHYDAAGVAAEAVARYLPAVRYALDVFAQDDALALASRALELCSDEPARFELHRLREEAAARAGDDALRDLDCASMAKVARCIGDDDLLGVALGRSFLRQLQVGEQDAAAVTVAELGALRERSGSARWAIEAAVAYARLAENRSALSEAEIALRDAEPWLDALDDDGLAFSFWLQRAFCSVWSDASRAREHLERARGHVGANRVLAIRALRMEAQIADVEADYRTLRRAATEMLELYRQIGDLEGQATAHRNLAAAAWYDFDIAADREHVGRAIALYERVRKPNAIAGLRLHRGVGALRFGDFSRAEADMLEARSMWETLSIPGNACNATICLSVLATFRGEHGRARELALEALASARDHGIEREEINALGQLGVAERDLGMSEQACEHLEAALSWRRDRDARQAFEALVDVIPVYIALGDSRRALAAAGEVLQGLEADRNCVAFPAQALATAAAAFAFAGEDARAEALSAAAATCLHELAGRIEDERSRAGYLSLSIHAHVGRGGRSGNGDPAPFAV